MIQGRRNRIWRP